MEVERLIRILFVGVGMVVVIRVFKDSFAEGKSVGGYSSSRVDSRRKKFRRIQSRGFLIGFCCLLGLPVAGWAMAPSWVAKVLIGLGVLSAAGTYLIVEFFFLDGSDP